MPAFLINTHRRFSAAHQLLLPDGSLEPLHGHNWKVRATVESDGLDAMGTVMDFHELERLVDAVVVPMHNRHLNELPAFDVRPGGGGKGGGGLNPSAENLALHVARSVAPTLPAGVRLVQVEVWETPENSAVYRA